MLKPDAGINMYRDDEKALLARSAALELQIAEEVRRLGEHTRRLAEVGWITMDRARRQRRRRILSTLGGLALLLVGFTLGAAALIFQPDGEQADALHEKALAAQKESSEQDERGAPLAREIELLQYSGEGLEKIINREFKEMSDGWHILGLYGFLTDDTEIIMRAMNSLSEAHCERLLEDCMSLRRE